MEEETRKSRLGGSTIRPGRTINTPIGLGSRPPSPPPAPVRVSPNVGGSSVRRPSPIGTPPNPAAARAAASALGGGGTPSAGPAGAPRPMPSLDDLLKQSQATNNTLGAQVAEKAAGPAGAPRPMPSLDDLLKQSQATNNTLGAQVAEKAAGVGASPLDAIINDAKTANTNLGAKVDSLSYSQQTGAQANINNETLRKLEKQRGVDNHTAKTYAAEHSTKATTGNTPESGGKPRVGGAGNPSGKVGDAVSPKPGDNPWWKGSATPKTGSKLGKRLTGAGKLGGGLLAADAVLGAGQDLSSKDYFNAVGDEFGIDNSVGKAVLGGLASIADIPEEILGRTFIGAPKAALNGGNYFESLFDPNSYDTLADRIRNRASVEKPTTMLSSAGDGLSALAGKADKAMPPPPPGPFGAPPPGTAPPPSSAPAGQNVLPVNNTLYDLSGYSARGDGIYQSNTNPNEFIGRGVRDPNPQPAYIMKPRQPVEYAQQGNEASIRSEYAKARERLLANGDIKKRDKSAALAQLEGSMMQALENDRAMVTKTQDAQAVRAVGERVKQAGEAGKAPDFNDFMKLMEFNDKHTKMTDDQRIAGEKRVMDMIGQFAPDEKTAKELQRTLGNLPPAFQNWVYAEADAGQRNTILGNLPGLKSSADKQDYQGAGGTILGGVAGASLGLGAAKTIGSWGGRLLDKLISAKVPAMKGKPFFEKMLSGNLVAPGLGAVVGAGVASSSGDNISAFDPPLYNPDNGTLINGEPSFNAAFHQPGLAWDSWRGDDSVYRTSSGNLKRLTEDEVAANRNYWEVMTNLRNGGS